MLESRVLNFLRSPIRELDIGHNGLGSRFRLSIACLCDSNTFILIFFYTTRYPHFTDYGMKEVNVKFLSVWVWLFPRFLLSGPKADVMPTTKL